MIRFPWRKPKPPMPSPLPQRDRVLSYQFAGIQGIGSRAQQEDAYALVNAADVTQIVEEGLLALMADGMGGMQSGAQASSRAIAVVSEDFRLLSREEPLEPQLAGCVDHACEEVYALLHGTGGSTMIACILYQQQLYYAGVGDSYLYLLRRGELIRLNKEQNVLHRNYLKLIRSGSMDPSLAAKTRESQAVTQFLGIDRLEDVDWLRRALPLEDGDVLLLCSDGVGGVLSQQEIRDCLRLKTANDACRALNAAVLEKRLPHQDNYTAVVIRCEK